MTGDEQGGRFAPPQAHVDDIEQAVDGLQLATRGSRLGAAMIDLIIGVGLMWVISRVTPFNPWGNPSAGLWQVQLVAPLVGFAMFMLVHGWLLVTRGQTVGKAALKIRIVRLDGSRASAARLLGLRYGVGWVFTLVPAVAQIWGLLDALLIFRASRRCLHDLIADTIVVRA